MKTTLEIIHVYHVLNVLMHGHLANDNIKKIRCKLLK